MDKNYKELYPKAYSLGFSKGEKSYERGYSRENTANYIERYADKSFTEKQEKIAFMEGACNGYNLAEEEDYKCCFKEQENEDL